MTPELCMNYARDYLHERYQNYEAVIVLHLESCRGDDSKRFAIHIGLNRSNLSTGRRLDEGPARKAAAARVKTIRKLDEQYNLRQLERGKSNSRRHARQPGFAEQDMARKDQTDRSENARIRIAVARRIDEIGRIPECNDRMKELSRRLAKDGIKLAYSQGGHLQYRFYSRALGGERKINGTKLGFARNRVTGRVTRFTLWGVNLAMQLAWQLANEQERDC